MATTLGLLRALLADLDSSATCGEVHTSRLHSKLTHAVRNIADLIETGAAEQEHVSRRAAAACVLIGSFVGRCVGIYKGFNELFPQLRKLGASTTKSQEAVYELKFRVGGLVRVVIQLVSQAREFAKEGDKVVFVGTHTRNSERQHREQPKVFRRART